MDACVCVCVYNAHTHTYKSTQTSLQMFSGNNHAFNKLSAHLALAPSQDISPKVRVK